MCDLESLIRGTRNQYEWGTHPCVVGCSHCVGLLIEESSRLRSTRLSCRGSSMMLLECCCHKTSLRYIKSCTERNLSMTWFVCSVHGCSSSNCPWWLHLLPFRWYRYWDLLIVHHRWSTSWEGSLDGRFGWFVRWVAWQTILVSDCPRSWQSNAPGSMIWIAGMAIASWYVLFVAPPSHQTIGCSTQGAPLAIDF